MFFMGNGHISSDWGLMGGYPAASGYRFAAHDTNLKQLITEGKPIPLGGDVDPGNPVYESLIPDAKVKRDKQAITTEEMYKDYDLYLNTMKGGPGFGDPLDRDPHSVVADLEGGYVLPRFADAIYGVVVRENGDGLYALDEAATTARRQEIRQQRLERAVPTREWMAHERQKIIDKRASTQVQQMFAASFKLGPRFYADFKAFWELPDEWELNEKEIGIPHYGSHYHMDLSELPDVHTVQFVEE